MGGRNCCRRNTTTIDWADGADLGKAEVDGGEQNPNKTKRKNDGREKSGNDPDRLRYLQIEHEVMVVLFLYAVVQPDCERR